MPKRRGPYNKEASVLVLSSDEHDEVGLQGSDEEIHIERKRSKEIDQSLGNEAEKVHDEITVMHEVEEPEYEAVVFTESSKSKEPINFGAHEAETGDVNEQSAAFTLIINKENDEFRNIYSDEDIGGENSFEDETLSKVYNEFKTLDDQEFLNDDINATLLSETIPELLEEEITEVNESNKEFGKEKDMLQESLFPGCSIKLGFLILLICSLSIRFKLPDEAMNYIMILIRMVLPPGNNMMQSIYTLKEYLKKFVSFPTIHYICTACGTHVSKLDKTCRNKGCNQSLGDPGAVGYFIQHSIINQLQIMCKRSSFLQKIRAHRFEHYKTNKHGHLRDVYDGSIYKKLFDNGLLQNPNGISFSMNTDGVPLFKSSRISMWPVYLLINELPISERKLKENILYYGLWICSRKPVMWSYLKPLHAELSRLENGVEMCDNKDQRFVLQAFLLNCVCDLPARCMLSNSMQYNGEFGCWYCYQPGKTHKTEKGGHTHIFPYQSENPKGPERTIESLQTDVNEVITKIQNNDKKYIVRGVKGPFWFMFLKNFDVIHGFCVDYMHGICAGVMRMLLNFWFDKTFKEEAFSLFSVKNVVNKRLAAIKPNIHITRPPRSLDELCHWKSAEFRNFLFLWGIPVLDGILPQEYFMHFCLLVRGIYNLSREDIAQSDLNNAEKCLFKFVELFSTLYPVRNLTMNCHQLLHIVDSARANGPLFSNNCFIFEDLNGYIMKNIHGTTGVDTQVINAVTMMQALPTLKELYVDNTEDSLLITNILRPNYVHKNVCIEEGIYQIGKTCEKILDEEESSAVFEVLSVLVVSVVGYTKIFMARACCPIYGSEYGRLLKRNQSIVKYKKMSGIPGFGCVKVFIQVENYKSPLAVQNFALIFPYECMSIYSDQQSSHIVTPQHKKLTAVPLPNIIKVCNLVSAGDMTYVSEFPNRFEKD